MLRVCLAVIVSCCLISCEDKEDDKVFAAQKCLDVATASNVDTCVNMIAGIGTNQAYIIRCSADFIRQGITTPTIVSAVEDLDQVNDNENSTVALFDAFIFTASGGDSAATLVGEAVTNCQATGSSTLATLALSAQMATTLAGIFGTDIATWVATNPSAGDVTTIANNPANADEVEDMAGAIISMQSTSCAEGGQFEGTDVCTSLNAAITGIAADDPQRDEKIVAAFLNQLAG